jgi:MFS family permease
MNLKMFENRWWVVVGSFLGLIVSAAPVATNTIGTFVKPISSDLGWTRSQVTLGLALSGFSMALGSVIFGRLMDRFGIRPVTLACVIGFGISMAAIGFTPVSLSVFTALYILQGFMSAGIAPLPYAKSISGIFDRDRGLALGVAIGGVGIGTVLVPQYAQTIIGSFGWREAYMGLGLLHLLVAFPAVLLWVREPGEYAQRAQRARRAAVSVPAVLPGKTVREALVDSAFWLIALPFILSGAILVGLNGTIVPMLTDAGMSVRMATTAVSTVGIATIAGRIFSGWLLDRMFAPYVTIMFLLVPFIGVLLFGAGVTYGLPFVAAFLVGIGIGGELDLMAFLISRYFGLRSFGSLYGLLTGIFYIGAKGSPYLVNVVHDSTGSYNLVLVISGVIMPLASFMIWRLGPYAYPVARDRVEPSAEMSTLRSAPASAK